MKKQEKRTSAECIEQPWYWAALETAFANERAAKRVVDTAIEARHSAVDAVLTLTQTDNWVDAERVRKKAGIHRQRYIENLTSKGGQA